MMYRICWAVFAPEYGSNRVPFVVHPGESVRDALIEFCEHYGWSVHSVVEVIEGGEIVADKVAGGE